MPYQRRCGSRWRCIAFVVTAGIVLGGATLAPRAQQRSSPAIPAAPADLSASVRSNLNEYCASCHSERVRSGGLSLATIADAPVAAHAATWESVVRKLKLRAMPPVGVRRPDEATYTRLVDALEG